VSDDDGHRCDDDQLVTLLTALLDDEEANRAEASTSAARNDQPAELFLEDVVAAGRAAFCWLDVVVTVRHLGRHLGRTARASAGWEPGQQLGRSPTGST
jgi:hypothetical protein